MSLRLIYTRRVFLFLALVITTALSAQTNCDIKSRVGADGALYYYIEYVRFYYTSEKQLEGGIVTDKEHYFLTLQPFPFVMKKSSEKLTDSVDVVLSNEKKYRLGNYYVRFHKEDSLLRMVYFIPKDLLNDFKDYNISSVKINMGGDEGVREYDFKLHKSALREHLACFEKSKN